MVTRHAIGRPRPSSPSGWTHHDQDQSPTAPQCCSSPLGRYRPRPCSLARGSCTTTRKSIFTHRRWLRAPEAPVCVVELQAATRSIASGPLERRIRGCPIPIANAAPSRVPSPAISSIGRLRTPAVGVCRAVVMAGIRKRSQMQTCAAREPRQLSVAQKMVSLDAL